VAAVRLRQTLMTLRRRRRPVRLGSLGRTRPVSTAWGYDRGQPVDRWFIERFLVANRSDITGRVLEVKSSGYTNRYGHDVSESAVLDIDADNERATHVADLATGEGLPDATFDCFLLNQTLQLVYDLRGALATAHRVLRPGGVLLITVPTTSRLVGGGQSDLWRFTELAVERLLEDSFGAGAASVSAHGNVLTNVAFLEGMASEDLSEAELKHDDPLFPLIVCARAVKSG
jgi:SAM-dependent methyltransferase